MIKILSGIAIGGSALWLYSAPGYEPAIAVVTSLATFIGAFVVNRRDRTGSGQTQHVGARGFGVQAGRDVTLGSRERGKK
jgi:hypothetical protein